jgi:hypothetical protein
MKVALRLSKTTNPVSRGGGRGSVGYLSRIMTIKKYENTNEMTINTLTTI